MTLRIDIAMNESALALFTPLLLAPPESLSPVLFWSLLGIANQSVRTPPRETAPIAA